jgi:redox-sensitive bicupin YhaK (pirin superfamily)
VLGVSGPVTTTDVPAAPEPAAGEPSGVEVLEDRVAEVGGLTVRRALPKRARRTVGPWCFLDHFGPASLDEASMQVGPHPHTGLATVTWVVGGEVLHRDSLGTEQLVRPGQLNLMSAGRGVAHAEESPAGATGSLHGVQLWVAQPEATRTAAPAFEHHAVLPGVEPAPGAVATVVVGELAGERSPARADHPAMAADLVLYGEAGLPLAPPFEHALVVLDGAVRVEGVLLMPGRLAHLGPGRSGVHLAADGGPARALLVGGTPFPFPPVMWWNFVGRTRDEVAAAREDWVAGSDRFGAVSSRLGRIAPPGLPWSSPGRRA